VTSPPKILIVDDNAAIRQGIRVLISNCRPSWNLSGEAANGEEAIQAAMALKPDVIVLDVSMPVIGGVEAAQRIANLGLNSCIVLLTALDTGATLRLASSVGAHGYVDKAQIFRDLVLTIEKVLAEKRAVVD
jgi:two-component system, NarL family, invasion response regulator UvrY